MSGYQRWAMSSQGAWLVATLFLAIALINLAMRVWWLVALMGLVGALNVGRAVNRRRNERAGI